MHVLVKTNIENLKMKPLQNGEFLKTLLILKVGGRGGVRALADMDKFINS
jgi:hypothetical protein